MNVTVHVLNMPGDIPVCTSIDDIEAANQPQNGPL